MHKTRIIFAIATAGLFILSGCKEEGKNHNGSVTNNDTAKHVTQPPAKNNPVDFNEDSAYLFIQKQVDFGPRVPGTPAHDATAKWLADKLDQYCDTIYVQDAKILDANDRPMDIVNLIGTFNPDKTNRVLLCAHWDTRPQADQDANDPTTPADGANDGGSGVGVLLEVARQLSIEKPNVGIDIVFFDAEDGGDMGGSELSWCLGSQYWSKHPHVKDYKANYGILLDMVGSADATFLMEQHSTGYAPRIVQKVWSAAQGLGFGRYFTNLPGISITDDHLFITRIIGIPTIDVISYDFSGGEGFGDFWHTHADNMDVISKPTLNAVGTTVLKVVYNER